MKTTAFLVAAGLLAISCAAPQEDHVSTPEPPILDDGAYALDKAVWTYSDSSIASKNQQIKIYFKDRYMFAAWNAADKTPSFAAGTVETKNGKKPGEEMNKREGQEGLQGKCQEMWRRERWASGKKETMGAMASTMTRQARLR